MIAQPLSRIPNCEWTVFGSRYSPYLCHAPNIAAVCIWHLKKYNVIVNVLELCGVESYTINKNRTWSFITNMSPNLA